MPRTIVFGDVHGSLKALEQLIEKIALRDSDRLIFLGDYVDGWSQSSGVIEYLAGLAARYACIFIKGNHDAWCEVWLQTKIADRTWLFNGGRATIDSYHDYGEAQIGQHLEFFNRMHNYFIDEQNRLFIHAGFSSMHGPEPGALFKQFFLGSDALGNGFDNGQAN